MINKFRYKKPQQQKDTKLQVLPVEKDKKIDIDKHVSSARLKMVKKENCINTVTFYYYLILKAKR